MRHDQKGTGEWLLLPEWMKSGWERLLALSSPRL